MKRTVDIIVPIFDAYEHVATCVTSVLNHTAGMNYRLILINDATRDERIDSFYLSLARENILFLKNEKNLGFVKTCNRGMALSEINDVVLLNTDTVVTKNWLRNLRSAVYGQENIGGAIPVSNHASVYSITELGERENPESIQKAGEILSAYSAGGIHEIPTAVGFCFYIKRDVIRKIGMFDEVFSRGYREENDFCMRAREQGFRFVLAENAFAYPYYSAVNQAYQRSGAFEKLRSKVSGRVGSEIGVYSK